MKKIHGIILVVLVLMSVIPLLGFVTSNSATYTGYAYLLNSDEYTPIKYNRVYSGTNDSFITKYTIYHPTKGYAWMIVTAIHDRVNKKVDVSIDDTNESIFSRINDETTTYETASIEPFGFRGAVGALGGKRVPNQLEVKFASAKFENVKVVHVLASDKTDFNSTMYFILDEKN